MRYLTLLFLAFSMVSCNTENAHDLTVKGHIKDLKKGTIYLQRQVDSTFVNLDSLNLSGDSSFELHGELSEPEVLFLTLDKNAVEDNTIVFFADKGVTEINTTLKNYNFDAIIEGSKQQKVLDEYVLMMSKFNDKNLDLIKTAFETASHKDSTKMDYDAEYNKLLRQKYLYTINFALNKKDSEVAPYLALTEVPNTSISYLEKIHDTLTEKVKTSKYGKALKSLIEERKKAETPEQ